MLFKYPFHLFTIMFWRPAWNQQLWQAYRQTGVW